MIKKRIVSLIFVLLLSFLFCVFAWYVKSKLYDGRTFNDLSTYVESNADLHVHEGDWFNSEYDYFSSEQIQDLKELYKSSCLVNSDTIAVISFSSDLLSRAVLKGDYSKLDWATYENNDYGSIYTLDDLDSSYIMINGPYLPESISDNRNLFFTPLANLKYVELYESNKYLMLMGKSEIVYYKVVDVNDGTWSFYDTNDGLRSDDRVLVLVVNGFEDGSVEYVICREIGREASYNE